MAFHDTLLCDEYTQDGSLGVVDEDVVGAAASFGGAFGGCRAGVGGVAGGADAPLREGGLRLRRRRSTRPVHLLHAETCWSGPVKVCAREFGGGGACASGSGRAGRRGGDRDLGDQRRTAGAAGVDIADDRYCRRAGVGSGRVRACGSGCGAGEYGDGDPASAAAVAALFGGFAGTTGPSDFPRSFIPGLPPQRSLSGPTGDHPAGQNVGSPGSRAWRFRTCHGSPTARGQPRHWPCCLPPRRRCRHPELMISRLNSPAYTCPCQRFAWPSRAPTVAVGTALSGGPPRRSQRAELPHWAPRSGRTPVHSSTNRRTRSSTLDAPVSGSVSGARCAGRVPLALPPSLHHLRSRTAALFDGFAGTTRQSDFPRPCISGVRPQPSPSGPHRSGGRAIVGSPGSRA